MTGSDDLLERVMRPDVQALYRRLQSEIGGDTELGDIAAVLVCLTGALLSGYDRGRQRELMSASIMALSHDLANFLETKEAAV